MTLPLRESAEHLILVPGHAVYRGGPPAEDASWSLAEFQKGEPPLYLEHVRRGVELTAAAPRALLVFSGGQTRAAAGPQSEARGYREIAEHYRWWGTDVSARATTEEYARDSLENLLFGICRFRECARRYPRTVTIIGWSFKAERFNLHREALRYPAPAFSYIGVNDPPDLAQAAAGEAETLGAFRRNPYAAPESEGAAASLAEKRRRRDPFHRHHPYEASCPEVAELLRYRGAAPYAAPLPWMNSNTSVTTGIIEWREL